MNDDEQTLFPLPHTGVEVHKSAARMVDEAGFEGEPVFVIRAKDLLSVPVITEYIDMMRRFGSADPVFEEDMRNIRAEFIAWQKDNPERVRYPD